MDSMYVEPGISVTGSKRSRRATWGEQGVGVEEKGGAGAEAS